MTKKYVFGVVVSVLFTAFFTTAGFTQTVAAVATSPSKSFANVLIKNFGKMDDRFYRGAQPKKGEYAALKELGIKTVIDLQSDPSDYEKAEVEALGMRYVNIPIKDKSYPTDDNIAMFLKTVDDPETGVFYAHCAGGRHRTGDMGALYRFTKYGWNYDQAFLEMKNYDFYSSWGHDKQKDFVADYALKIASQKAATAATAPSQATGK